jgi:hypothetical protein
MSAAPITPPPEDNQSRFGRLLDLVRRLIDYGRELTATLTQHSVAPDLSAACAFGTIDIRLILARITLGLLRANALEVRLVRRADRPDTAPAARRVSARRQPRATAPTTPRTAAAGLDLAHLPTPEQIAAQIRRQPIGAVIADICRDLGIRPCHPLWRELSTLIIRHGGNLAALVNDILRRTRQGRHAFMAVASPPLVPLIAAPAGTGPP